MTTFSLLVLLALGFSPAHASGTPAAAPSVHPTQALYGAGYRYCDAVLLAQMWGVDEWDAKMSAGQKILDGNRNILDEELGRARNAAVTGTARSCHFWETGYTMEQAEQLALAWGTSAINAKVTVTNKATRGYYDFIDAALALAPAANSTVDPGLNAFLKQSTVDACHAHMLSKAWGSTLTQAKSALGNKIAAGNTEILASALEQARHHAEVVPAARCTWADVPFTYRDAEVLAAAWGIEVSDAKARVTEKYLHGSEAGVKEILPGLHAGH